MAKITKADRTQRDTVVVKTRDDAPKGDQAYNWWAAKSKKELADQLVSTAVYLKEQQQYRFRQASLHARMYGNQPLASFAGQGLNKVNQNNNLPVDRPTFNVIQSCVDTLISRLTQGKPRPIFLTDNGNYKQRNLAKQLNQFIVGEFHNSKAYQLGETAMRVASILGTGCVHVYESDDNKVALEHVLQTELFVDPSDAFYGNPRSLYRTKLVDRQVLKELFPEVKSKIEQAEQAYPDNSDQNSKAMSDQIMVVEGWHLPSSKKAQDGRHTIACSAGLIHDEPYKQDRFPFVFFNYSPRLVGMWAQGLAEQLAGTQIEINKLLITISKSISLVGVPRVFVEDGSKVVKSHLNDQIGAIVTYRGTKPEYEVAPSVHPELYAQLQRLIDYAYQQSGISAMAAASQKPQGLNSGEAIRNFDDLQTDRFATLEKRQQQFYQELAEQMFELACSIAERDGSYSTIYPDKDGTREIDLPEIAKLKENPYVIQCYDTSSLPRDPAGRLQKVTEMMQAGIIDLQEGRRLLDFPDLQQVDKLAMAAEERILKQLDDIVDSGKYTPPDPFTDLQLAKKLVVQYYNLYTAAKLEESKAELLRTYQSQILILEQAAMPPMPMAAPGMPPEAGAPIAAPTAPPTSDMLPIVPQ